MSSPSSKINVDSALTAIEASNMMNYGRGHVPMHIAMALVKEVRRLRGEQEDSYNVGEDQEE